MPSFKIIANPQYRHAPEVTVHYNGAVRLDGEIRRTGVRRMEMNVQSGHRNVIAS
jgi:hypothetical protein